MKRTTAPSERAPEGQQLKKKAKKSKKTPLPVTAADIAPPSSHYEVMLNRGVAGLNSMAEIEGNYLTREQVDNVWKACVRSQRKDPQLIQDDMEIVSVESIKGIGCKELFVCVIGDFIVLPGPIWVGMKMTTALKGRMTSTRHVTSFHNAVTPRFVCVSRSVALAGSARSWDLDPRAEGWSFEFVQWRPPRSDH